jgi:uncharacterized protein YndB with AHSA1/START domain
MSTTEQTPRDFTLTWTLDAAPADVFEAWTDPDQLGWYYNPDQPIPTEPIELDLRVGGAWRQRMVVDEATAYVTGGIYREIVRDEKLVFSWGATDGWPELDLDRLERSPLVTITLSVVDGFTEMTLHVELPASFAESVPKQWFDHIETGWSDTVDRLTAAVAQTR